MKNFVNDIVNLFYPQSCAACNEMLVQGEKTLCMKCRNDLPQTHFHSEKENLLEQRFWGRVKLEIVVARYFFRKGSRVQSLLHNIKYHAHKESAVQIAREYGSELHDAKIFDEIDFLIPIPMHHRKKLMRGFNQSEEIAKGLSETLHVPVEEKMLKKIIQTKTQTRKHRYERWENVNESFIVTDKEKTSGKNILLVDDVITTGATIEAAAEKLIEANAKVYVAALACSMQ